MILPSGVICSKRVPFSYSASATRPPSLNDGCCSNQCTEQPSALYGLWPSLYVPLVGRTSEISLNLPPFLKPPLPSPTPVASQTMKAPTVSSQVGEAFVSPPASTNLSLPPCGHWLEWMKRLSSLVPVASSAGLSGVPPSSGRSESSTNGWQEPSSTPGWISRRWWQEALKYGEPS